MDREELYELLDIDAPADFEYFENLAALLECDEYLEYEDIYALMEGVDKDTFSGLVDNYFDEITDFIPGDMAELYTLLEKIKFSLMGLARSCDEEDLVNHLSEEVDRFRKWYSMDSVVFCNSILTDREEEKTLRDALVLARLEGLDGEKYTYDFSQCLDYHLDEYVMSFGDIIAAAQEDEQEDMIEETIYQ